MRREKIIEKIRFPVENGEKKPSHGGCWHE